MLEKKKWGLGGNGEKGETTDFANQILGSTMVSIKKILM